MIATSARTAATKVLAIRNATAHARAAAAYAIQSIHMARGLVPERTAYTNGSIILTYHGQDFEVVPGATSRIVGAVLATNATPV